MNRLTVFAKSCLILLFLICLFLIFFVYKSVFYTNEKQFLIKNNLIVSKNNQRWYWFNWFKNNTIEKKNRIDNNLQIPIRFQIINGDLYQSLLKANIKVKIEFLKQGNTNIQKYILDNIQSDILNYSGKLTNKDIYFKREEHINYIKNILNNNLNKNFIQINKVYLKEIQKL